MSSVPFVSAGGSGSEYKAPRLSAAGILVASMLGASTTTLYGLHGHAAPTSSIVGFNGSAQPVDIPYSSTGQSLLNASSAANARSTLGLDTGDSPTFTNLILSGGLTVQGTMVVVDSETVLTRTNYHQMNVDYTTVAAQSAGFVANYLPTSTTDTIASGGLVAGVAATSDITITTTGSNTFSANDIIQISGSQLNDGFYAVQAHSGTTLTLKSTPGLNAPTDAFLRTAATTSTTTGIVLTKVNVSVLRCGTDGAWEVGSGSADGITFSDIATAGTSITGVKTANYTAVANEHVRCDASGGTFTVTLPAAASNVGRTIEIANEGASGTVTVGRTGSDLINGATTDSVSAQWEVGTYRAITTNVWRKI